MSRRAFLQSLGVVASACLLPRVAFAASPLEHALQQLDQPTRMEFVDRPLKDVVAYVSAQHRMPIRILKDTYAYGNVIPDQPVTKSLRDLSLRSALNLLLDDLALDYRVTDRGEILIFTAEQNAVAQRPVSAVQTKADERNRAVLEKAIVSLEFIDTPFKDVIAFVADQVGVAIVFDREALEAVKVDPDTPISINLQKMPLHRALTALLYPYDLAVALRDEVFVITARDPKAPRRPIPEDLRRAAETPVHVELLDPPLKDALAECSVQANVTICFDHRRVERVGIAFDAKVTGPLPKLPLREALHRMLEPIGLRAMVCDEVLFITPNKLPN